MGHAGLKTCCLYMCLIFLSGVILLTSFTIQWILYSIQFSLVRDATKKCTITLCCRSISSSILPNSTLLYKLIDLITLLCIKWIIGWVTQNMNHSWATQKGIEFDAYWCIFTLVQNYLQQKMKAFIETIIQGYQKKVMMKSLLDIS